ncbi:MAG: PhnP protein [Xanthobacteraceae bacterium]|nr:MAG: PhnP protein [Xanthobacteraceae bacterium]
MALKVTILGCGSSGGVPRVGQGWGACDPTEPRNRRRRCALLIEQTGPEGVTTVLVDTGPDVREQLLDAGVTRLDAVLYTHDHADHTHGIDDLRPLVLTMRRRIAVHADEITDGTLRDRFGYCFASPPRSDYPPIVDMHIFAPHEAIMILGPGGPLSILPVPVVHGAGYRAFAFRFDNVVYCPDISALPEMSERHFSDARMLILDALRYTRHPTHLSVDEALAVIARFQPQGAVLTNLHSDIDYRTIAARLPDGVVPAYDRMVLDAA